MGYWTDNPSTHLAGFKNYTFLNDYTSTPANSSLDITGGFSLGWQLLPNSLNAAHWFKGTGSDPTTPTNNALYIACINNYLKIYLHDTNGTGSLVYITNNPVWASSRPVQADVTWDPSLKELLVYINGSLVSLTIDTTGPYYDNPTLMGLIANGGGSTQPILFGKAPGQPYYKGTYYRAYLLDRVKTSVEIAAYYLTVKDNSAIVPEDKIIFCSNRGSSFLQICSMNAGTAETDVTGSNPVVLITGSNDLSNPVVNPAKTKILYTDNAPQTLNTSNLSGGSVTPILVGVTPNTNSWSTDGTKILALHSGSGQAAYFSSSLINTQIQAYNSYDMYNQYNPISFATNPVNPRVFITWGLTDFSATGARILQVTTAADNGGAFVSSTVLLSQSANYAPDFQDCKYSPDGTKIGFTRNTSSSSPSQVCIMDADGGNMQQLTAYPSNSRFHSFSPVPNMAGLYKIIFSRFNTSTSKWQLWVMYENGTKAYNISNNSYTDLYADWVST